uniref:AKNA domain-containing protein n=1 Tax=Echeneis naucrates TaxID=173247 RepID=A0A665TCV2_ECHNA
MDDTSSDDEDQEDLPYDGDLGSLYFSQTAGSEGNTSSDSRETVHASPDAVGLHELTRTDGYVSNQHLVLVDYNAEKPENMPKKDASTKQDNFLDASKPSEVSPSHPADINQLLLRHFTQEELLRSGRLIEAETLPEVSLLESMDDTILSWAPKHNNITIDSKDSEMPACKSEINLGVIYGPSDEKSDPASINSSLEEETESKTARVTSAADSITSNLADVDLQHSRGNNSVVDVVKKEKSEEDNQVQRVPLTRTRSFSEMKYGQGQVHYPLPDFSKVAPKVKIPKALCGPARPFPQSPNTMHRAQSSPGMLEVISRVLEDSVQPSEKHHVFKDQQKQTPPALVHHLQV